MFSLTAYSIDPPVWTTTSDLHKCADSTGVGWFEWYFVKKPGVVYTISVMSAAFGHITSSEIDSNRVLIEVALSGNYRGYFEVKIKARVTDKIAFSSWSSYGYLYWAAEQPDRPLGVQSDLIYGNVYKYSVPTVFAATTHQWNITGGNYESSSTGKNTNLSFNPFISPVDTLPCCDTLPCFFDGCEFVIKVRGYNSTCGWGRWSPSLTVLMDTIINPGIKAR